MRPVTSCSLAFVLLLACSSAPMAQPAVVATLSGPLPASCRFPSSVMPDPSAPGWIVASARDSVVARLDGDGTVVAGIGLPSRPSWIGPGAPGTVLAVSALDNELLRIDASTGGVISRARVSSRPVCATEFEGRIYVPIAALGIVTVYRSADLAQIGSILVDEDPSCLAVDTVNRRLLVGSAATGRVLVISVATGRVVATIGDSAMPVAICVDSARPAAYIVDKLGSSVTVLDLSASPPAVTATVPVGECPTAAALDETTGILYVTCNTSPSASVWTLDPVALTAAKLVEFPDGPDPVSIAVRPGVGMSVADQCVSGVSLASLAGENPSTVPTAYSVRDICGNAVLGHVYAAYASRVPFADGGPGGAVVVRDSATLATLSTFPTIAPAAASTWEGGSKVVLGGTDGFVAEYDAPDGTLFGAARYAAKTGFTSWIALCVAEFDPWPNGGAFLADMWTNEAYTFSLPSASYLSYAAGYHLGFAGDGHCWYGFWEADSRLFCVASGGFSSSVQRARYNPPSWPGIAGFQEALRPSLPGSDGIVCIGLPGKPSGRIRSYTMAGAPVSGKPTLQMETPTAGRSTIVVARNQATGRVYVADWDAGTVEVYDGALNRVGVVSVGGNPFRLWVDETTGLVYVGDYETDRITVIEDPATVPTLSVSEAAAAGNGTVASVVGGVVKSTVLSRGATGYLWYYFDIEPADHSATLTVFTQTQPTVQIGQVVDVTGTIQSITVSPSVLKSIVARELVARSPPATRLRSG